MKKLIVLLLVTAFLLANSATSVFAGTYVWKNGKRTVRSPVTNRLVTVITGAYIYKYYSSYYKRYRFKVVRTYSRYQTDGNVITTNFNGALWLRTWRWDLQWKGANKSHTGASSGNWIYTGAPNKTYNEGKTIALRTYYRISDGSWRGWTTEAGRDVKLSRYMTSDGWL